MPNYRRNFVHGATYFFTVVTYKRKSILTTELARSLLHHAWIEVSERFPFNTLAVCLLPDHIHCIWTLPEGDADFPTRWRRIKGLFTRNYLVSTSLEKPDNASRLKRGEAAVWQRRFWEHTIRDEDDLHRLIDYIHFNPLKHGYVSRVVDWPWSTFHRYMHLGYYESEWGANFQEELLDAGNGE